MSSSYTPPPPEGFVSPMTWGVESHVIERFTGAGVARDRIAPERDTSTFRFPRSPAAFVDEFRRDYGPTMNAFEAAEKAGRAADLQRELETLFQSQNKSPSTDTPVISATFLRVTVTLQQGRPLWTPRAPTTGAPATNRASTRDAPTFGTGRRYRDAGSDVSALEGVTWVLLQTLQSFV